MPRLKKLTDYVYSPTNPASEDAIRQQIDDSIQEVYDASAKVGDAVLLNGNQTVAGIKTFSSSPIIPAPTTNLQPATKKYVDDGLVGVSVGTFPLGSVTDEYLSDAAGQIKDRVDTFQTQYEYRIPTVVSQEIQVSKPSDSAIIKFKLSASVSGGAITISTDSGSTSLPLVEEDGTTAVTSLDIGLHEVVYATSFFILKSKGTKEAIYGKRDGTEITLVDSKGVDVKIKENEYIYMNENTQLVLDNPIETVYDRITPVQVVNAAYDTSGNGGRKLVRLNNGTLVSATKDTTTARLYKSTDNGATWTLMFTYGPYTGMHDVALTTDGVYVYMLAGINNGSFAVSCRRLSEDGIADNANTPDISQSALSGLSITIDSNGHLHATWSSKNATYPNSFNIRYSKSTDGGVTWASPTQVTVTNNSGYDRINPCIVVSGDTYPKIIYQYNYNTTSKIGTYNYNGSSWSYSYVYESTYTQSNPSATVDSNGVIHVAWHGKDSTDATVLNIRYSKSTDNGVTWSAMQKLTSGNTQDQITPSITTDVNNNVYILFNGKNVGTFYRNIRMLKYVSSWTITEITNQTTNHMYSVSVLDNYKNFEIPMFIWQDNVSPSVKFYGKWTESNSPQIIPSLATATAESKLQAIGDGTLKSLGSTDKFYVGYHSKVSNGFTPL